MSEVYQERAGADRYAKFDPSISRMRIASYRHQPCATCAYIYCLKNGDYEAAELIRKTVKKSELEAK